MNNNNMIEKAVAQCIFIFFFYSALSEQIFLKPTLYHLKMIDFHQTDQNWVLIDVYLLNHEIILYLKHPLIHNLIFTLRVSLSL